MMWCCTCAVAITILLGVILFRQYQKLTNAICTSTKKLDGKTAIVTGGTAGIGLEIAKDFSRRGAKVIIACPFEQEGLDARRTIIKETGKENVVFKFLDLGSLKSVRAFAVDILKTEKRLDLLINNAGITLQKDILTEDGLNITMQVNYYGHFLLTILLLPLLKKAGQPSNPSRIVNTSSIAHAFGKLDIETMNKVGVNRLKYANSKFCTLLFSRELSRRLQGAHVVVNTADPGFVGTDIYQSGGKLYAAIVTNLLYYMCKTPWEGAQTSLHVALDEKAGGVSGENFKDCKQTRAKASAYDSKLTAVLWTDSIKLVKLGEEELEQSIRNDKLNKSVPNYIPAFRPNFSYHIRA